MLNSSVNFELSATSICFNSHIFKASQKTIMMKRNTTKIISCNSVKLQTFNLCVAVEKIYFVSLLYLLSTNNFMTCMFISNDKLNCKVKVFAATCRETAVKHWRLTLLAKRGRMLLNSSSCSCRVWPHCSETSMTYRTAARRWARAVMACISMVFLSSRGWSRIPGVSTTFAHTELT